MGENEKPKIIYMKKADISRNRILIPSFFIKEHGYYFYMNIYDNKIELIPIKKNKQEKEN